MAQNKKHGLNMDALSNLYDRINPASIAHTAVSGEYWPVYLRPHLGSEEQTTLGVVLKFTDPPIGLLWRLAQPEIMRDFYADATLEQWRWQLQEVADALAAGDEASPEPNSIIYGKRLPFQGRSPERALNVLFDAVAGLNRGLLAPRNHGGIADNPEQTTSELLRSVIDQLGLASQLIEQFGRASIYRVNHQLVTTLDLAPAEYCERHASDILTAAAKMTGKRHKKETMSVCALCTESAEQTAAELIERLKTLDVSFVADAQPEALKRKIEAMLTGNKT